MTRAKLAGYLDRWGFRVLAIAMVITILLFLASLVVIYWGDEYASPSWSTQSVPAPKSY